MDMEDEEEGDCTAVSQPLTDSQVTVGSVQEEMYKVQQIKQFLQKMKHCKNVKFEDHFGDKMVLLTSMRAQMNLRGEGGFTDQEFYRLKNLVRRIKLELLNVEDNEDILFFMRMIKKKQNQEQHLAMMTLENWLGRLLDVVDYKNSSTQIICVDESPQTTRLTLVPYSSPFVSVQKAAKASSVGLHARRFYTLLVLRFMSLL
ncbi:hypothetical protein F2P81_002630 [Scophthalmus maximus]|uniref:Uncharacterized protein n=1 Tax=Scophthalmus maximus TaxID=52904 RepID=A0A6A4TTS9_SCOMX|nr:hypothetical protein F2P81_002630 [Scophthalmus maximus]